MTLSVEDIMAVLLVFVLFSIVQCTAGSDHQQAVTNNVKDFNQKELCQNSSLCFPPVSQRLKKYCRQTSDCDEGEYCHTLHRFCIRHQEPITISPLRTPAKECYKDSDCKRKQFCHPLWKICLSVQKTVINLPTRRPTWYCKTSNDCRIEQQCHKTFHTCYNRPLVSAVRRSDLYFRRCQNNSDCGPGYYCHDHFRLCLKLATGVNFNDEPTKKNSCTIDSDCGKGMKCHKMWKLCFMTPQKPVVQPKNGVERQCRLDSDCKKDEFCYRMSKKATAVVARHRRDIQSVCLPLSFKDSLIKPPKSKRCKTNADCGPNKCCLVKLGVCQPYQLPGGICLVEKTDFLCPCSSTSYCMNKNKIASPKRIINKMNLPKIVADYVMKESHKKKYKVGKCTMSLPGSV